MTTQVPAIRLLDSGVAIPEEDAILSGVLADIDAAFGGGMSKSLSTPQGQFAQSLTAIIGAKNAEILEISNQVDPDRNTGKWQDAIGRIYFMERLPGRGTVVEATCYGLIGALIPAGSMAQDASGHIYSSTAAAIIGSDGQARVQFQCQELGPIACPPNSLTRIYVAVTGWERINNDAAGVPGALTENRYDFEQRRRASVSIGGAGMVESLRAELWRIPGVADVYVTDNDTDAAVTRGITSVEIPPHSLYVAVFGGSDEDVATAIWRKKPCGCGTSGTTSYTLEVREGYSSPYPQYTYKWQVPTPKPVYFHVQIARDSALQADITDQVQQRVLDTFQGRTGAARATIGGRIYAGQYYAGMQALGEAIRVASITLGFTSAAGQSMVELGIDEMPTLDVGDILVELIDA